MITRNQMVDIDRNKDKRTIRIEKRKKRLLYALSYIIPMMLLSAIWAKSSIYPFGKISNMKDDLGIQYVELYSYLQNVFLGKANLGYSFTKGLGGSSISLFAYYLSSPINLLLLLFKQEDMQLFIYWASILKVGLCGLFQAFYLTKRFEGLKNKEVLLLSTSFAVSYYTILQVENLMWMDGVYMLPLVMYGVWNFKKRDNGIFLTLAVAASILFNWYTAYMNCLFAIIYFLFELFKDNWAGCKKAIKKILHFGTYMLWGILISCALFLPNIYGLRQGKGNAEANIWKFGLNGNIINLIRGFVLGNDPGSNLLILFSGSACLILATAGILYLYREKKREFIISSIFIVLMLLSLLVKPLENIWNGFRYANSYMYRFSYLQIWMIVYFSAVGLRHIHQTCRWLVKVSMVYISLWIFLDYIIPFNGKYLYLSIFGIMFMNVGWHFYINQSKKLAQLGYSCILGITILELCFNGIEICKAYTWNSEAYIDYVPAQNSMIEFIKANAGEKFYRIEQTLRRDFSTTKNSAFFLESMGYNYNGLSHYSSTFNDKIKKLGLYFGYGDNDTVSMYDEPILTSDSLLGIKYILADTQYPQLQLKSTYEANGKRIYENPYALPIGFPASKDCMDLINLDNHFIFQNEVYSKLLGKDIQLYYPIEYQIVSHGENEITFEMNIEEGQILYGYADSEIGDISLYIDGKYRCFYQGWLSYRVFNIGSNPGIHQVKFENFHGSEEQIHPHFYRLDLQTFREVISYLKKHEFELEIFNDGYITGNYEAEHDGWILLTIPMEKGWKGTVNGESIQLKTGINALMLVPVKQGNNSIVLKYHVPYLRMGFAISIISAIMLALYANKSRKKSYTKL